MRKLELNADKKISVIKKIFQGRIGLILIFIVIGMIPLSICALLFYISNSSKQNQFSEFGNFLTPIISLMTTLLLIYITTILNNRDAKRSINNFLFQYRTNVYNQLVSYATTINCFNSQCDTKSILNRKKIARNKRNIPYVDVWNKELIEKKEDDINTEIQISTDEFYADMLYEISEIRFYIKHFEKNNCSMFNYDFPKSNN
jgi:hypothetical protein